MYINLERNSKNKNIVLCFLISCNLSNVVVIKFYKYLYSVNVIQSTYYINN